MTDPHDEKIQRIEVAVVKIASDVGHLKDRFENGFSVTMASMDRKLTEHIHYVTPKVKDNCWWVNVFKKTVISMACLGVTGLIITTILWFQKFSGG